MTNKPHFWTGYILGSFLLGTLITFLGAGMLAIIITGVLYGWYWNDIYKWLFDE